MKDLHEMLHRTLCVEQACGTVMSTFNFSFILVPIRNSPHHWTASYLVKLTKLQQQSVASFVLRDSRSVNFVSKIGFAKFMGQILMILQQQQRDTRGLISYYHAVVYPGKHHRISLIVGPQITIRQRAGQITSVKSHREI